MATYDGLSQALHATVPRLGGVRVVTVDGPSGSGKTQFAGRLFDALSRIGSVTLVEFERFYAGWSLDGAWARFTEAVLEPLADGRMGRFHPYDWAAENWSSDWDEVGLSDVLVVEGCGSNPMAADNVTSHRIWVQAAPQVALARAIARDGVEQQPRLRAWQELQAAYFHSQDTRRRSDLRVDGDPPRPPGDNPETTFAVLDE